MNRTGVEWVKNPDGSQGYSWNPITGCLDSCAYCYARRLANGRLKAKYLANNNMASNSEPNNKGYCANPFYPRFWPERLNELPKAKSWTCGESRDEHNPRKNRTQKGIFVCNMCEFFGEWVPARWQREIFSVIRANPLHRFYFLTKQPQNVPNFSPFPDNCWIGVTVCDNLMATNAWKCYFDKFSAKLKFISFEPLLEDLLGMDEIIIQKADWIIIGSQTKPYNPPKIEWVQAIVECAEKAGKPVFLKDNLKPLMGHNLKQELPECPYSP